jgi:hypothetical protein
MVKVKNVKLIYDNQGLDSFKCSLGNNQLFDIEICDFYYFLVDNDQNLLKYSEKFQNWDELTQDLLGLGFPLTTYLESYINTQFTSDDIIEFTYSEE